MEGGKERQGEGAIVIPRHPPKLTLRFGLLFLFLLLLSLLLQLFLLGSVEQGLRNLLRALLWEGVLGHEMGDENSKSRCTLGCAMQLQSPTCSASALLAASSVGSICRLLRSSSLLLISRFHLLRRRVTFW